MSPDADPEAEEKLSRLLSLLKQYESAVLAFSGGVDSSFLLRAMGLAGMKQFVAVTACSGTMPSSDYQRALSIAVKEGAEHLVIRTDELANEEFVRNFADRCFHCKDELYSKLGKIAEERQFPYVFDGTNTDDLLDYRPGLKAAAKHGVRSPLAECGFSKKDIRNASRRLGLGAWDQPSSPCLSSRVPYGRKITAEALRRIEASEEFLRTFGLTTVRVRDHGDIARIEVPAEDMAALFDPVRRRQVSEKLRELGYAFVSVDLDGYRSGSMNRTLELTQH